MTREEWKNIFADNLISALEERGMTQRDLAEDSGVAASTISDYISKRQMPNIAAAINIAYALDMDITELVDFDERIDY